MLVARCAPEMIEADLIQRRRGGVAREVAAVLGWTCGWPAPPSPWRSSGYRPRCAARARDHPGTRAAVHRNGIDVGGIGLEGQIGAGAARVVDQPLEQEMRALGPLGAQHRIDRLEPFARFCGVEILLSVFGVFTSFVRVILCFRTPCGRKLPRRCVRIARRTRRALGARHGPSFNWHGQSNGGGRWGPSEMALPDCCPGGCCSERRVLLDDAARCRASMHWSC